MCVVGSTVVDVGHIVAVCTTLLTHLGGRSTPLVMFIMVLSVVVFARFVIWLVVAVLLI